jgi:DNA-binding transcriptional LysR family regulator
MKNQLEAIKLFVRVARSGSFSKVAREVGIAQSSVSRIVAELEKDLGAALLSRTTRAVVLNEAGRTYLCRVEQILAALDEAGQTARGTGELRGILRVGTPFSLGLREIVPGLPLFLDANPALRLDVVMDDQRRDLVREGVDVALRIGKLAESTATSRRLATVQRVLVAAPAYLERSGAPATPADLARHPVIVGPAGDTPEAWTFSRQGRKTTVRVHSRLSVNNNEAAVAAAVAGLGILSTGSLGSRRELNASLLVRVLTDWTMGGAELNAVFPAGRASKLAARAFVDFLLRRGF